MTMSPMPFIRILALLPLAACATYIEEETSRNFAPLYDEAPAYTPPSSGAIFHQNARGLFVNDRRASRVGDVLTVQLTERFQASKSQSARAGRSSSFEMTLPTALIGGFDNASLGSDASQSFSGNGAAAQSNSLSGRVSVSVMRVLPNGHLEVMGQKRLTLNNGQEYVRLTGVIRPEDIGPDNVVSSDRVAHADISYVGAGDVADTGRKGWLNRALTTVSPL
jgi:flagellar L-ring protein precursor FlgH